MPTPSTSLRGQADIGYTGQRLDAATGGLMFYGARYYSPAIGRFISADSIVPDPANPQSLNRYAYVNNDPVKYIDPSGHKACDDENGDCSAPIPIPKCTADYCKHISAKERKSEEEAYRLFLADPGYFAELWANPEAWNHDETALYFRRYVENYLHQTPDQFLVEGIAEAYGDEFARTMVAVQKWNMYAAAGMSTEDLKASGFLPTDLFSGELLYGTVEVLGGTYQYTANAYIEGKTLAIRGIGFFPVGGSPPPGGARLIALQGQLIEEARALGFTKLEVQYTRLSNGRTYTFRIPLSGGDRKWLRTIN